MTKHRPPSVVRKFVIFVVALYALIGIGLVVKHLRGTESSNSAAASPTTRPPTTINPLDDPAAYVKPDLEAVPGVTQVWGDEVGTVGRNAPLAGLYVYASIFGSRDTRHVATRADVERLAAEVANTAINGPRFRKILRLMSAQYGNVKLFELDLHVGVFVQMNSTFPPDLDGDAGVLKITADSPDVAAMLASPTPARIAAVVTRYIRYDDVCSLGRVCPANGV